MGSENSKFIGEQELPHEYRPLKQLPGVYQSILNGSRLQKHKLELNSQAQINYQKDIFVFRRMNADRVISANFFQKFIPSHFCNMSFRVCFFTEYPSYIMSHDLTLPSQRSFQLLIECLKGFQILYGKFGAFNVSSQNIFFDSHHQPKLWISPDLGKTRVQHNASGHSSQQQMIHEIFKIFDQVRDERNAKIIFSNYLKRLQDKMLRNIVFKNVIEYMIDEASKFFISRSKSDNRKVFCEKIQPKTTLKTTPNRLKSPNGKQGNSNVISLRTKTRNNSKNSNTNSAASGFCNFVSPFAINGKITQSTGFTEIQKVKKSKRHNSQEDCPSRDSYFTKENFRYMGTESYAQTPNYSNYQMTNPSMRGPVYFQQDQKNKNSGPIRLFRRSLEQIDKPVHYQQNYIQERTKRLHPQKPKQIKFTNKQNIQVCHHHAPQIKFVQSPVAYKQENNNPVRYIKNTVAFQPTLKTISSQQVNSYNISSFNNIGGFLSPIKDYNQSHAVLSNLQTLKSIVNSDYSDIDSQIKDDLQNLDI